MRKMSETTTTTRMLQSSHLATSRIAASASVFRSLDHPRIRIPRTNNSPFGRPHLFDQSQTLPRATRERGMTDDFPNTSYGALFSARPLRRFARRRALYDKSGPMNRQSLRPKFGKQITFRVGHRISNGVAGAKMLIEPLHQNERRLVLNWPKSRDYRPDSRQQKGSRKG